MTGTPIWISVAQLILTGFLGLGAAAIAFMQWRTAHQKVVLDLFEKRVAVLLEISALADKARKGDNIHAEKEELNFRCGILFDRETKDLLRNSIDVVVRHKDSKNFDGMHDELLAINQKLQPAFRRYVRMDQKLVRTPLEWFHDANERRKSYGDHHFEK